MSSAEAGPAAAGPAAAVTNSGGCERTVLLGKDKHVVKLTWRYVSSRGVLVVATLVDNKHKGRASNVARAYVVENTEEAVRAKVVELTDRVLKNKREKWEKAQQQSGSSSSSSRGVRRNADREVADPVIAGIRAGGETRSGTPRRWWPSSTSTRARMWGVDGCT